MTDLDPDRLLALLKDPNVECAEIAAATGAPRDEVGRAARLLLGLARAKPEELVTLPAPLAIALTRAALAAARADLLAALAGHAGKDVSKEAKRSLHILKSRGVAVPELARQAAPAPAPASEPPLPAYATAVDGRGERAVWLPRTLPGKGVEVGQAVVSDQRGLLELQVGLLGRKEWRAFVKGLVERGAAMGAGPVDRGQAHALLAAARGRNEITGQRVPDGADLWLGQLGPAPALEDPAARFPRLPDDEERSALEASGALHDLPLLQGWLADEDYLRQVAAKLDEIEVSPLYLDEQQRAEQASRAISDAVDAYFDAPRRAVLTARLFSVAEHLEAQGDARSARAAAASARALDAGSPARSIPFARLLVEKAFPPAPPPAPAPAEGPAAAGGAPLIVAPR